MNRIAKIELDLALKLLQTLQETKEKYPDWKISVYHLKQIEVMLEAGIKKMEE